MPFAQKKWAERPVFREKVGEDKFHLWDTQEVKN